MGKIGRIGNLRRLGRALRLIGLMGSMGSMGLVRRGYHSPIFPYLPYSPYLLPILPILPIVPIFPLPASISEKQFLVRSAKICPQVEIALEGGVPKCTSPFRAMSLGRRLGLITRNNFLSEGRRVLHSAKMPPMGSTRCTSHRWHFF